MWTVSANGSCPIIFNIVNVHLDETHQLQCTSTYAMLLTTCPCDVQPCSRCSVSTQICDLLSVPNCTCICVLYMYMCTVQCTSCTMYTALTWSSLKLAHTRCTYILYKTDILNVKFSCVCIYDGAHTAMGGCVRYPLYVCVQFFLQANAQLQLVQEVGEKRCVILPSCI